MKTSLRIRIITMSLVALVAFTFASKTFAITFQKIVLTNSDGISIEVNVDENGNYKSPEMKAGTYTYSWTLVSRPTGSNAQLFGVGRGISSPTGGSADRESRAPVVSEVVVSKPTDREASAPSISEVVVTKTMDIVSPRDPASGLPTGKRMHKPITITKEIDKSSPLLSTKLGEVVVDTDGTVISGTVSFKSSQGQAVKASWNLKENVK